MSSNTSLATAQLPPSSVFGAVSSIGIQVSSVRVLVLIENSLPIAKYSSTLQLQLLPSVFSAIRLANPGKEVEVYWRYSRKTQLDQPEQFQGERKLERNFNELPDINIVDLPYNKLSPSLIRQSLEDFLLGDAIDDFATQHVVLIAMSDQLNEQLFLSNYPKDHHEEWSYIADILYQRHVALHLVLNPSAEHTDLCDVFRGLMLAQSRQEVIPWPVTDDFQLKCLLSGGNISKANIYKSYEWPKVTLETCNRSRQSNVQSISSSSRVTNIRNRRRPRKINSSRSDALRGGQLGPTKTSLNTSPSTLNSKHLSSERSVADRMPSDDGNAPFLFDPAAEVRNFMRLKEMFGT